MSRSVLLYSSINDRQLKFKKISSDQYGCARISIGIKKKKGKKKVLSVEEAEKVDNEEESNDEEESDDEEEFNDIEKSNCVEKSNSAEENIGAMTQESFDDDQIGKFYCVYFDNQRYWGKLQKVRIALKLFLLYLRQSKRL